MTEEEIEKDIKDFFLKNMGTKEGYHKTLWKLKNERRIKR